MPVPAKPAAMMDKDRMTTDGGSRRTFLTRLRELSVVLADGDERRIAKRAGRRSVAKLFDGGKSTCNERVCLPR